jgi:hypothetical protein
MCAVEHIERFRHLHITHFQFCTFLLAHPGAQIGSSDQHMFVGRFNIDNSK